MTLMALAWRSLRHYRRAAAAAAAGAALATAVLTGALLVGDSARATLRRIALDRLGGVSVALSSPDRLLSERLADALASERGQPVAGVLRLSGVAVRRGAAGTRQVNRVQVLGVPAPFWALAGGAAEGVHPAAGQAALGRRLAERLGVSAGDELTLRLGAVSLLPLEAPLASRREQGGVRATLVVSRVLEDGEFGRFGLEATQIAPLNLFVDRAWLQERARLAGRVNLLVAGDCSAAQAEAALGRVWSPADTGYRVRGVASNGVVQLECERVYLDPEMGRAARGTDTVGALTYLVNSIAAGDGGLQVTGSVRRTPYSFVTAVEPSANRALSPVPAGLRDDEILVNRWLADQLQVAAGDRVTMAYSELAEGNRFVERRRSFTVRIVLPMESLAAERALVPAFPGLTDVESCSDWDIGLPTDPTDLADPSNEAYWDTYGPTPKAFVTLAAGQAMWANRFGDLTAVRRAADGDPADWPARLARQVEPASLGLVFQPVRELALSAARQGVDLGGLFLGMSFFLVLAALILTALLFALFVEARAGQAGLLLALGFRPAHLRRLFLAEGLLLAAVGGAAGVALGALYARLLLWGLLHGWQGAVAGQAIQFTPAPASLATGWGAGLVVSAAAMLAAVWRQARRPPQALLQGLAAPERTARRARGPWSLAPAGACGAAAAALLALGGGDERKAVGAFFGAGALLLVAGLALTRRRVASFDHGPVARSLAAFGRRAVARRPHRSLAVAALLACGSFLVAAVSAMREDAAGGAALRSSGTGGFAWYAEATAGAPEDLNTPRGIRWLTGRDDPWPDGVRFVGLKLREGDDASCFNLNRAQTPRLVGVDAAALARLGAFVRPGRDPWRLLDGPQPDGAVPALAGDADTALWGLRKKPGDVLLFRDERGREVRVRLVGTLPMRLSVFQGMLLVPLEAFNRLYPSESGARVFLVDGPAALGAAEREELRGRLTRAGLDVTDTAARLREFYTVESTYLGMFLVLGGLGVLLGTAGLAIVVVRNVQERRAELAMLRCAGIPRRAVVGMVLAEHRLLLGLGLLTGLGAALVAVAPSLRAHDSGVPWGLLAAIVAALGLGGLAWTALAARAALRGQPADALREE